MSQKAQSTQLEYHDTPLHSQCISANEESKVQRFWVLDDTQQSHDDTSGDSSRDEKVDNSSVTRLYIQGRMRPRHRENNKADERQTKSKQYTDLPNNFTRL